MTELRKFGVIELLQCHKGILPSRITKFLFLFWIFCLSEISFINILLSQDSRGSKEGPGKECISLTFLYHFQPLHRHLDIIQQSGNYCRDVTSAHSKQPDSNRQALFSECNSLTTKLRTLKRIRFIA